MFMLIIFLYSKFLHCSKPDASSELVSHFLNISHVCSSVAMFERARGIAVVQQQPPVGEDVEQWERRPERSKPVRGNTLYSLGSFIQFCHVLRLRPEKTLFVRKEKTFITSLSEHRSEAATVIHHVNPESGFDRAILLQLVEGLAFRAR